VKISVYITSYNQKDYLQEAIESVLVQTLRPHQIIIIDDCSNDGSQQLIADFQSQYPDLITPIYHDKNTGIAQVRNDALLAVTGDYVTHVDGDDRILPTKLEKEANLLLSNPYAELAFSNYFYITEDGACMGIWADSEIPPEGNVFCQIFARDFPRRNLFRNELVNYQAWETIGFYDPKLNIFEDYDMRIRLTKKIRVVYHNEPLSEYRLHDGGLSAMERIRHFEALDYIYRKNKSLIVELDKTEREYINNKVRGWIAPIAGHAAVESFKKNQFLQAAKLFLAACKYDPDKYFNWRVLTQKVLSGIPLRHWALIKRLMRDE